MPTPANSACAPATPAPPAPYPTEFHFRNDTAAPLFLNKDRQCAGIEYGVSSCARFPRSARTVRSRRLLV
jgi:hypothetical protein